MTALERWMRPSSTSGRVEAKLWNSAARSRYLLKRGTANLFLRGRPGAPLNEQHVRRGFLKMASPSIATTRSSTAAKLGARVGDILHGPHS